MCGIAGYIGYKKIDQGIVKSTLNIMKNRGPDGSGFEVFEVNKEINLYFLHTRLSIIDLDERSNQPFSTEEASLIFNGEIYNYKEIKSKLGVDISWRTNSDTEVLLQSYLKNGMSCVQDFEGMWSFAIFDKKTKVLYLSRDRFAEKPLYLFQDQEGIYFASEIKFILSLVGHRINFNQNHLYRYLVNGYKSLYKTNETYWENIFAVPFATNITIDLNLNPKHQRYWKPIVNECDMSLTEAVEGFKERLFKSLELRLRSDVPIAFCLSGGVDSAALTSIASKEFNYDVSAFSIIDKDPRYNELENINATVYDIQCKSHKIYVDQEHFVDRLKSLVEYFDAPVATISYYVHSMLSEKIAEQGFKVVFSGTAADELVTGYYDHFILHLYGMKGHPDYEKALKGWEEKINPWIRNPLLKDPDLYSKNKNFREHVYFRNDVFSGILRKPFLETFKEEYYCNSLLKNRMLNELFHEATPLILHEDDHNSMFRSIENRSPYLDKNLMEFSYSIPREYLIREGVSKYVLRQSCKGVLNDQVRLNTRKMGFNASIMTLFNLQNKKNMDFLLADSPIFEILDKDRFKALFSAKDSLPNSLSKYLFSVISAKLFLESKVA